MALFDMPLEQLRAYKPERVEPSDFDAFWAATLREARSHPLNARFELIDSGLVTIDVYDVTFNGYGGQPVKGWLRLPHGASGPLPCVVEFIGDGGGRGFPWDNLGYASAGFAHLYMDTRGQGSTWVRGDTPDLGTGSGPAVPGFMTQGILDPTLYYYRRVFTDGVRAVEAARSHPAVDASRIALTGGSQGGGITIAVAGLVPDIEIAMPDVPFLCAYRRATEITDSYPYQEIVTYLKVHRDHYDTVFHTLSYFDGVNFAPRARAKALFSTALMDMTCPPSTVFAAYNHWGNDDKDIRVYPYNQHEGGASMHHGERVALLHRQWG